jgi:hypothetical protein
MTDQLIFFHRNMILAAVFDFDLRSAVALVRVQYGLLGRNSQDISRVWARVLANGS